MLAQISHEFRSPLNGIILLSQAKIDDEEISNELKEE